MTPKWIVAIACLILMLVVAAGCGAPKEDPVTEPTVAADPAPEQGAASDPEAERVAQLVEAAKKEGKVAMVSSAFTPEIVDAITTGFREKYDLGNDFVFEFTNMTSSEVISHTNVELDANKVTVDILSSGIPEYYYDLIDRGELAQYESPEYKYFPEKPGLTSEPGYWVSAFAWSPVMMWNPDIIDKDLVKYEDILDPEFAGLICMGDGTMSDTYLSAYRALYSILGREFMERLAELKPVMLSRSPDLTNRVVTGETPIAFTGNARTAYNAAKEGAKIKVVYPEEGSVLIGSPFVILERAPHPNAARLLIDYLHTEEALRIVQLGSGYLICREGMPPLPEYAEFAPPIEDIKVIPIDWREFSDLTMINEAREEFREIFGLK